MNRVSSNYFSDFLKFHFPLGLYVIKCFTAVVFHSRLTFLHRRYVRVGAGKSLARHTSPCCRTESIVSLERGVCSCAELQAFSCYRG